MDEDRSLPGTGIACGNGICPAYKTLQCLPCQLQQRRIHGFLFCQPGIEELLYGPGCLTKFVQTDHARTALERVKRASQRGLLTQIPRLCIQGFQRCPAIGFDLADLLQKDLQQFIVYRRMRHHGWQCSRQCRCCSAKRSGFNLDIQRNRVFLELSEHFRNMQRH